MSGTRKGYLPIPSFAVWYGLCAVTFAVLVTWILADAYCLRAFALTWADLSGDDASFLLRGQDQRPHLREWARLGTREVLVGVLLTSACITYAGALIRLFVGRSAVGRGVRGWAMFVALTALWLGAWAGSDTVRWWGVVVRMRVQLSWYDATVSPLLTAWPSGSINLPGGLYHQGGARGKEYLWATRDASFHPAGDPARYIYRRPTLGGFLIAMRPEEDCLVEYTPNGPTEQPLAETNYRTRRLHNRVHLNGPWYVLRVGK